MHGGGRVRTNRIRYCFQGLCVCRPVIHRDLLYIMMAATAPAAAERCCRFTAAARLAAAALATLVAVDTAAATVAAAACCSAASAACAAASWRCSEELQGSIAAVLSARALKKRHDAWLRK